VRESLLIEPDEIQYSEGRELLNLRGQPVPLRRLSQEFDIDPSPGDGKYYVVILGIGDLRMGLLVDRLEGQQDTVIKPIQGPARKVRGIAGATELAEQGAVLVLDVSALTRGSEPMVDHQQADGAGESTKSSTSWDLLARAAAWSRETEQGEVKEELLAFVLAGCRYAIPVAAVREIVRLRPMTTVPRVPPEILGVIPLRGEIVQVMDLRRRLGVEETVSARSSRIIVLHGEEGEVAGLLVDTVTQVLRLSQESFRPNVGQESEFVAGLWEQDGDFISMLSLERVLSLGS